MRQGQEIPSWTAQLNAARDKLREELKNSRDKLSDGLFEAIDRFVHAKIEASKRERY